jgi:enoyl-CoA hydratase/carnithine racemase
VSEDLALYEVIDRVAVVTLNRPERLNAWTPGLAVAYFDRLDEAVSDPRVGAIVVTGAGRGFCPGADMAGLQALSSEESGVGEGGERREGGGARRPARPTTYPMSIPKLMVAAINGACAGLGLVQALLCDVRIAAAGAKFTTAFARRGLIAEHGVSWVLPRIVGTSTALDLLASARVFTAEEAADLGVVNRVVPPDQVLAESIAYAQDVAANCSPASVAAIKGQLHRHITMEFEAACADSDRLMVQSLKGPDFKEGVSSYIQKRPPEFAPLGKGTILD